MTRDAIMFTFGAAVAAMIVFDVTDRVLERRGREAAKSAYVCGLVREHRRAENLPREMPNNEAECSRLEYWFMQ